MQGESIEQRFSLKCRNCEGLGVPLRVDLQAPTILVLALRCRMCGVEWVAKGDLPVFLAWVKPDRRQRPRVEERH
jgi:hypothetical protein